jgi:hypothetical protein
MITYHVTAGAFQILDSWHSSPVLLGILLLDLGLRLMNLNLKPNWFKFGIFFQKVLVAPFSNGDGAAWL